MSPAQFLAVVRGRWRLVASIYGVVVLAVLAAALLRPAEYTATATLVIDPRPDPVAAPVAGAAGVVGASAFLATQVDILRHERVARRALEGLSAPTQELLRARWQAQTEGRVAFEPWAVEQLQRQGSARLAREGGVVEVSAKAPEPRLAAELANAWVRAYIDTTLELRVQPARQFTRFFEERAQVARATLEAAQGRLSAFQREQGLVATEERLDIETARMAELSSQLTALQASSSDSASRQAQATGAQADRLQEVLGDDTIRLLKAEIGRTEAQLQQLGTRLGDRHPQVQEQRAELASLRQRLEAETQRVASGVGVVDRINRQRLAETRAAFEAQRAQLLRMKAARDEAGLLQREVEQAQRSFDAVLQRLAQTRLEGEATGGPASVLGWAEAPISPSSPHPLLAVLLAALLGALLAGGVALGLEWRQRRVRCAEDVATLLQLPLLLSLPRVATPAR